jgi:hypothetical protein
MTTMGAKESPTYVFGRRDRGGLLIGLRATQLLVLAVGFAAVLTGLLVAGSAGGVTGFGLLAACAVVALFPIQGRPLVEWIRPLANHLHRRMLRRTTYLGGPFALRRCATPRIDVPGLGQHLKLYAARTFDGHVAALRMANHWTIVLQVRSSNYVLADRATQERRIADWGAVLSQCGQEGSRIARLQWLERTIPDNGHALEEWWQQRGDNESAYAADYAALIEQAGPSATRHDAYVAVSIDATKLRRPIRQAGGGPEGTTKVLLGEVEWLRQALTRADIEVQGVLGAGEVASLIRSQYDPASTAHLEDAPPPTAAAAGPMAAEAHWDHYVSDSGVHAVYWIAEWPSVPVEAAWVYPLIALGGVRRTVSVTAEPIPPSRSMRELRSQRVAKRADEAQRQRMGQVETAQDDEEYAALERREQELVHGHTEYRYTGWITVSATSRDELEASCATVEQAAVRSALEVRRVYGEVDQAFLCGSLPLTLGVTR